MLTAIALCAWSAIANPEGAPETAIIKHEITGPYQPSPVAVEVLAPRTLDPGRAYPVLYILPVEAGTTSRWGSGIVEAARADVANRFGVFCVAPAFAATPWFADHPTDPALRQESHFIKTVLPWVEANYPVEKGRSGRFLLGFSKSGYGAVMLLLRHPELFERAAAWDAPIDKTKPDQFKMIDVFGTEAHFERYAIPNLIRKRAGMLQADERARLILMPNGESGHSMNAVQRQLAVLGIPHVFEATAALEHHWESGWLARAAALLLPPVPEPASGPPEE